MGRQAARVPRLPDFQFLSRVHQMDRYAIFVDAGYLFAAAGSLCFGTSHRRNLNLDPEKATLFLRKRCGRHCDQPHLRTYWYDGAPDAVPTDDQVRVGEQQGVKLRLGRLTPHGQKGVDPRIVRDLIVLSRNGAMRTAYLMSGDEDVREGVVEAQEFGVAVILLGIESLAGRPNQAATLIREADDLITLSRTDCMEFITRRVEEVAQPHLTISPDIDTSATPGEFGESFGRATRGTLDPEAVSSVVANRPRIARPVDACLIKEAVRHFGDPLPEGVRHEIREGFWKGIETAKSASEEGADVVE